MLNHSLTTADQKINEPEYPSIIRRYLSTFIDGVLILIVLFLSSFVFSADNNYIVALRIGSILSMVLIYEPLCTSKLCTIGQMIMGIRVRRISTFDKISLIQAYARIVVKISFGFISLFTIILSEKKRAVHDFVSGSIVVVAK